MGDEAKAQADFDWDAMDADGHQEEEEDEEEMKTDEAGAAAAAAEEEGGEEGEEAGEEKVFLPGAELEEDEELVCDPTAYVVQAEFTTEWPCLSFDLIHDSLGEHRSQGPLSVILACGTQAAQASQNSVLVLKVSNVAWKERSGDEEEESEDEEDEEAAPEIQMRDLSHRGGVNRLRVAPHPGHVAATWAESGKVHIWNLAPLVASLEGQPAGERPQRPLFSHGFDTEGFALDWSPVVPYRLANGCGDSNIYLWNKLEAGKWAVSAPNTGHEGSVEDLQWSPNEANVLASCSADKTVRIWDARQAPARAAITVNAHASDVNVISWNRLEQHLLVSGADDGRFSVWDLRTIASAPEAIASFQWHHAAITSVEWHRSDASVLAVSGADDQVTLWDLAVEADDASAAAPDVPPQLLFVHQGQENVKEAHWHAQIPGLVVSTAESGFNIFKSISV